MRKKLTLMFVALLSIAAFAATQALSRRAVAELTVVSKATTWDFSTDVTLSSTHEGDLRYEGNAKKDENIYANISELSFAETFKADALAFTGEYPFRNNSKKFAQNGTLHFKTSVAGKIVVTFSDTGSSASATAVKRYLVVNGTQTEYWSSRENNGAEPYAAQLNVTTKEIAVPAGDVTITGSSAITVSYIAFTPELPANAIVYDFAAEQKLIAASTVEKPGHVNGNQNNGQGFNAYSVKIRNDYKGFAKKEGSTLPDVCHVWRRSDRFDQDASWNVEGGLNMPNNREMAIDGLDEGAIVYIFYDAAKASDGNKDIIWAVGEKDADGNAVGVGEGTPVTTATIGEVEAVPGETVIPSGAAITIKSVTPAVKGTGYIVFQVKKNMVISKIAIVPAPTKYDITTSAENGKVTTNPEGKSIAGETITVNATPDQGYEVNYIEVSWVGDDLTTHTQTLPGAMGSFTMPDASVTVKAVFKKAGMGAAVDVEVPANLGAMDGTTGPTDLSAFLASYTKYNPIPAYIKLTLQGGADYVISKPIEIMTAIQILGNDVNNPANIDASALGTNPFVKIMTTTADEQPAEPNSDKLYTTIYNAEFKNINVSGLKGQFFFSNGQAYLLPHFTVDNCVIGMKGASGKTMFQFNGGYVENFSVTNSTLWADDATTWSNGGLFSTQSGANKPASIAKQTLTIKNNTVYNISKGKVTATLRQNSKDWMWFEVKNNIIVNCGETGGKFIYGLNARQNNNKCNWVVLNNSFFETKDNETFTDVSEGEMTNGSNMSIAACVTGDIVFLSGKDGIAEGNFSLGACPQREAKIGDPRWLSASMTITTLDDDQDLAKAINQGVADGFTKFQLAENARYSVKQTIVADKAIAITGKNVIIDVEHNDPFILLSKTPTGGFMPKASTEAAAPALNRAAGVEYTDYYKFDELTLSGLKVNGLKNSIIYDNNVKYCVTDLTIDDCVMQLETEAVKYEALIAFQAGGVNNLTIKNSTFYGNNEVAKYFVRYNNSARIDRFGFDKADDTWSFTYENNTFYGLLKSDGQWGNYNGIVGKSAQGIVTVKNNIWYNCDAQTMRRLLHSKKFAQFSSASQMENNTFFVGGEVVDQGDYGNGSDLTGDPGFKRPAEGDFTLSAYSEQFDKKTGDPRWYADGGHYNPVTGIEGVEAEKADDGAWYTIQGVRVDKPAKGLYIHNGKKVVVK